MRFSVYSQVWNAKTYNIDYKAALINFMNFLEEDDEIVIAVNTSEDETLDNVVSFTASLPFKNIIVVPTDFSYTDIEFDGKIKNEALQKTTREIKIQMDIDERFDLNQKDIWRSMGKSLWMSKEYITGWLVNTIDVYETLKHAKIGDVIGQKFRMHIGGISRGVPNEAWLVGRTSFDTSVSDSTEPIDSKGNLINNFAFSSLGYTVHLGYLNYKYRAKLDEFWNPHWKLRSGNTKEEDLKTVESLQKIEICEHNLDFRI